MRSQRGLQSDEDADHAATEAAKGALYGAASWGIPCACLGAAGYILSPLYRGLTVQFKVFLQMSGMTLGSMIEADRRLRAYEGRKRVQRRLERDAKVWAQYEREIEAIQKDAGDGSQR